MSTRNSMPVSHFASFNWANIHPSSLISMYIHIYTCKPHSRGLYLSLATEKWSGMIH
jgi:hypothetical protein